MIKRPSKDDTEEDLLRMQEAFLRSKSTPSVNLMKKPDKRKSMEQKLTVKDVVSLDLPTKTSLTSAVPPQKRVKFKQTTKEDDARHLPDDVDVEERLDAHDTHIAKVLTEIVERDIRNQAVYYPAGLLEGAFPKVLHRGHFTQVAAASQGQGKKRSLFAQQFLKSSAKDFGVAQKQQCEPVTDTVTERPAAVTSRSVHMRPPGGVVVQSNIVRGVGLSGKQPGTEVKKIHEENVDRISGMSEQEILEEQRKLLETLDPSLVAFLRKKPAEKQQSVNKPGQCEAMDTQEPQRAMQAGQVQTAEVQHKQSNSERLDLPVQPDKKWLHMNRIEYDKLEWTKQLPAPSTADKTTGHPARFDFQGNLVAPDADVPVHVGLHHHGDEPERAGYTLEELFQLSRSTHIQQRVLSLNTLANIIDKARHGSYNETTSSALIPVMLDGGLLFIVRWALDDTTDNTMSAAINCLHRFLICREDEEALETTFHWYRGSQQPALCPQTDPDECAQPGDDDPDKPQQTDADVIKMDVIQGLLRMSLLERLKYILDKWRPVASVVVQILDIITRIARHSTQASYQITQCAGLLDGIVNSFLPMHWQPVQDSTAALPNNYGYPVSNAMKLIRVLCTSSKNIASSLLAKYGIMDCVTRYLAGGSVDALQLNQDGLFVYAEAFRIWHVYASYGLAMEYYSSLYGVLMNNLQSVLGGGNQKLCILLCPLLEAFVHVAANTTVERSRQRTQEKSRNPETETHTSDSLPAIDWSQVIGLKPPIKTLLEKQLQHYTQMFFAEKFDLSVLSCLLNFVASYISVSNSQPGYNAVDTLAEMEKFVFEFIEPCVKSQAFQLTLQYAREHSVLISSEKSDRREMPPNLPEVGALVGPSAIVCPILHKNSCIHFLVAFTRVIVEIGKSHKAIAETLFTTVLQHEEILQYVRKICICKQSPHAANYFTKFENILQHNLIIMSRSIVGRFAHARLYHQMALYLLTHLHHGDEHVAHDLLSSAVFNAHLLRETLEESPELYLDDSLQLQEEKYLTSATLETVKRAKGDLVKETGEKLVSLRNTYLQSMSGVMHSLQQSRWRCLPSPLSISRLQAADVNQLLMPLDWVFIPLVEIYNRAIAPKQDKVQPLDPSYVELTVLNTLRWVHLLECKLPSALDAIRITLKLSRLLCVFLAGSNLFLERNIHAYMLSLLKLYCKPTTLDRLNLEEQIPGLVSFYDLYMLLIRHYEAVSFADSLFACYILLPLQQRHLVKYRRAVWGEYSTVLTALTVPLQQVVIPISRFLAPEETHVPQLRLYFQCLFSGHVTANRTPLPYLTAVHHLNRFVYTQDGAHTRLKRSMIQQILSSNNQSLQKHLLYYKQHSEELDHGMELYEQLPSIRHQLLHTIRTEHS